MPSTEDIRPEQQDAKSKLPGYERLGPAEREHYDLIELNCEDELKKREAKFEQHKEYRAWKEADRLATKDPANGDRPYKELLVEAERNVERFHGYDLQRLQRETQRALEIHVQLALGNQARELEDRER